MYCDESARADDRELTERYAVRAAQERRYGTRRLYVLLRRRRWLRHLKHPYQVQSVRRLAAHVITDRYDRGVDVDHVRILRLG